MNLLDLPDDILVYLLKRYLNIDDLLRLSMTCKKLGQLIDTYNLWAKFILVYPILDFSYPYGYEDYFYHK